MFGRSIVEGAVSSAPGMGGVRGLPPGPRPSWRNVRALYRRGVGVFGTGHGGGDLARTHGVYGDAVLPELHRHDLGQEAEAALGGTVGRGADARDVLVHGGDVDDPAAFARLDHPSARAH